MTTTESVPADTLAALATLVEARSGLRFAGGRYSELGTRVARAFVESQCATWTEYQAQVTGGVLFEQLVEALTIGETYFYRHRPYFDMLERDDIARDHRAQAGLQATPNLVRWLCDWRRGVLAGDRRCGVCCPMYRIGRSRCWPRT